MGWVFFQVILAFGLAVFIVWWTFPREDKKKDQDTDGKD